MGVRSFIRSKLEDVDERLTGNTKPSNYELRQRELGAIAMLTERDDTDPNHDTIVRAKAGIEAGMEG